MLQSIHSQIFASFIFGGEKRLSSKRGNNLLRGSDLSHTIILPHRPHGCGLGVEKWLLFRLPLCHFSLLERFESSAQPIRLLYKLVLVTVNIFVKTKHHIQPLLEFVLYILCVPPFKQTVLFSVASRINDKLKFSRLKTCKFERHTVLARI